jgi:hypothetical protein
MTKLPTSGIILAGAVLLAITSGISVAQVRQVQMGNPLDANPQVGTGGANQPVAGYVPINGNEVMSGNVAGLKYFHGQSAISSPYQFGTGSRSVMVNGAVVSQNQFGGNLGSSALAGFARQSAGSGYTSQSLNQIYYLPSATVSTGNGALYSAPMGGGFDSALVPAAAISPTALGAQISEITRNATLNAPAINRALPATLMDATAPAAGPLATPLFSLRLPEISDLPLPSNQPGNVTPESPENSQSPQTPTTPGATTPNETPAANPAEVIGAVGGNKDPRITPLINDRKNALVGDTYMKLDEELRGALGPSLASPEKQPPAGALAAAGKNSFEAEIDPLTGMPRRIAKLAGADKTAIDQALSPKSLTDLSTTELTAGRKVKPVNLAEAVVSGSPQSQFDILMVRGEQNLKNGKYLDALQNFQAAQANKSEDPLAVIGRAHAELGAGAYSSAAYDLKFVFTRKPGMVSVKYDPQSFIPSARQEDLLGELQKMTAIKEAADMASFLYCYICYETGRDAALQAELTRWSSRAGHDKWVDVLTRAWITPAPAANPGK